MKSFIFSVLLFGLFFLSSLMAEDIVDLHRKIPSPADLFGGTVNIENGRIDLHPPLVAHFIENDNGSFSFTVNVVFRDSTPRQTVTGRVEVNLYRETGTYGSSQWELLWAGTREIGSPVRNPRLIDQYTGDFVSPVLIQKVPLRRYRVEMKASTHGTKGRNKRIDDIFSVVRKANVGKAESALALLLSTEASQVYRHFAYVFSELLPKRISRRNIQFGLQRFHLAIRRFNYLVRYLAANPLLEDRFAFGHSLTARAAELSGITPLAEHDIALPHYFVLDKQILEALTVVAREGIIDFERAAAASRKTITAIENYAYEGKWSVENLNHELYWSERNLVVNEDSYSHSLVKASSRFNRLAGKLVWSPGDSIPEKKYLKRVEEKGRRFFDVPRYVAFMETTALRAVRSINGP